MFLEMYPEKVLWKSTCSSTPQTVDHCTKTCLVWAYHFIYKVSYCVFVFWNIAAVVFFCVPACAV